MKNTGRGSLSRLWQAKSLFLGGRNRSDAENLSPIKQVVLKRLAPILNSPEIQQMAPGAMTGITIALSQVSDRDLINFLFEIEGAISETLDECEPYVNQYAESEQLAAIGDGPR